MENNVWFFKSLKTYDLTELNRLTDTDLNYLDLFKILKTSYQEEDFYLKDWNNTEFNDIAKDWRSHFVYIIVYKINNKYLYLWDTPNEFNKIRIKLNGK